MSAVNKNTISELQEMFTSGKSDPVQAAQSCFTKIQEKNSCINAFVALNQNASIQRAKELHKEQNSSASKLWAVPVSIADNICSCSFSSTCASKILENYVSPYNAHVVEKLVSAGANIIGVTNMDEFSVNCETQNSQYGTSKNPLDEQRVAGGAHGGAAAAVAAGLSYAALIGDHAGSVYQSASFCGLMGFKPSYGAVSRYGAILATSSLDQVAVLTRSLDDTTCIFSSIAGFDPKDANSANIELVQKKEEKISTNKALRLGIVKEFFEVAPSAEVQKIWNSFLKCCEQSSIQVVELSIPLTKLAQSCHNILASAEASTNLAKMDGIRFGYRANAQDLQELYTETRTEGFSTPVKETILLGTCLLSADFIENYYRAATKLRRVLNEEYTKALAQCDVLISPSTLSIAPKITQCSSAQYKTVANIIPSLTGLPSVSIPMGKDEASNMPVGLQIIGSRFSDLHLLEIAKCIADKLEA